MTPRQVGWVLVADQRAHPHALSPLRSAHVHMVEPVVICLVLLRADVAAPRRTEVDKIKVDIVANVGVAPLEHTVEPPLERAGRELTIPLDPVPDAECDNGGVDVRVTPLEISGIFCH